MSFKVLARKKHGGGIRITESHCDETRRRRFTATIRGWRNWRLWEGPVSDAGTALPLVTTRAREIRDRIDANDTTVFREPHAIHLERTPA